MKRFCDICKTDVHIGLGGEGNWKIHTESKAHAAKASAKSTTCPLTSWYGKRQTAADPPSQPVALPAALPSTVPSVLQDEVSLSSCCALDLLEEIRTKSECVPSAVLEGSAIDALAQFSADPTLYLSCNEPWENVNGILHGGFGYDATVEDLVKLIRCGPYGIVGFTNWVEACIRIVKIDGVLLENRLEKILEAVVSL